ncbi:hypothetical protein THALO_70037 [Tenacibaculum halocynthiae]
MNLFSSIFKRENLTLRFDIILINILKYINMLRRLSKLGTTLTNPELKLIQGSRKLTNDMNFGPGGACSKSNLCPTGQWCICDNDDCTSGSCQYT